MDKDDNHDNINQRNDHHNNNVNSNVVIAPTSDENQPQKQQPADDDDAAPAATATGSAETFNIETQIQRIWSEQPGLSVSALRQELQKRHSEYHSSNNSNNNNSNIPPVDHDLFSSQRVRAVRETIPYRFIETDGVDDVDHKTRSNNGGDDADSPSSTTAAAAAAEDNHPPRKPNQALPAVQDELLHAGIQKLLEQRSNYRATKRLKPADAIVQGLQDAGVLVDDRYRTYQFVRLEQQQKQQQQQDGAGADADAGTDPDANANANSNTNANAHQDRFLVAIQALLQTFPGVPCQFCGRHFGSRNAVFEHLRNAWTPCGAAIVAAGQSLTLPPSSSRSTNTSSSSHTNGNHNQKKKKKKKPSPCCSVHRARQKTGSTARHADTTNSLWMGDIPLPWTKPSRGRHKRLAALLFQHLPAGVAQPWIKTVVRKAYRHRSSRSSSGSENDDGGDNNMNVDDANSNTTNKAGKQATTAANHDETANHHDGDEDEKQPYVGYAIVVFRDAQEATAVRDALNGLRMSVHNVYSREQLAAATTTTTTKSRGRGGAGAGGAYADLLQNGPLTEFPVLKVRAAQTSDCVDAGGGGGTTVMVAATTAPSGQQQLVAAAAAAAGLDPPLSAQLQPLTLTELRQRICWLLAKKKKRQQEQKKQLDASEKRVQHDDQHSTIRQNGCPSVDSSLLLSSNHNGNNNTDSNFTDVPTRNKDEFQATLEQALSLYNTSSMMEMEPQRPEVRHQGRLIPAQLRDDLLKLLETLRWPAQNQREGLSAERYLVLTTNNNTKSSADDESDSSDVFYGDLRRACRALMQWADPEYQYSGVAVTKNFIASPHIDDRDQSYQYACSLGTFTAGGELCVEGCRQQHSHSDDHGPDSDDDGNDRGSLVVVEEDFVNVVETRNRIARVDGRNVHWVRTWDQGDRYSLIFYDTTDRNRTDPIRSGVDLEYLSWSSSSS